MIIIKIIFIPEKEIENLRKERDSAISSVNVIKNNKDEVQFTTWSLTNFRSDVLAKNLIKTNNNK